MAGKCEKRIRNINKEIVLYSRRKTDMKSKKIFAQFQQSEWYGFTKSVMQNGRIGWYNTEYWKAAVDLTMFIVGQFCLVEFSLGLLETNWGSPKFTT